MMLTMISLAVEAAAALEAMYICKHANVLTNFYQNLKIHLFLQIQSHLLLHLHNDQVEEVHELRVQALFGEKFLHNQSD